MMTVEVKIQTMSLTWCPDDLIEKLQKAAAAQNQMLNIKSFDEIRVVKRLYDVTTATAICDVTFPTVPVPAGPDNLDVNQF